MISRQMRIGIALAVGLSLALGSFSGVKAQREIKKRVVEGDTLYTVLKPGDIPAIFEPKFISLAEAGDWFYDDEPLIVVVKGDEVKAYSAWHLDGHEVVNDRIGGDAIAVTW